MHQTNAQTYFFFTLLAAVVVLSFFIFLPFLNSLVLAGTLAILFRPLFRWLRKKMKRDSLAAFLTLLIVVILIITPLFFLGRKVVTETLDLYSSFSDRGINDVFRNIAESVDKFLGTHYSSSVEFTAQPYLEQIASWMVKHFGSIFSGISQAIFGIFIGLIALYYFLKDAAIIKSKLIELSPLANEYDKKIIERMQTSVNSVIRGTLTVSLIQGVLTGFGLFIFGVPNPALWGLAAMFAAMIPGLGTSLVIVPSIFYLIISNAYPSAIGLLIWGVLGVGLIDNFLGPRLVGRKLKVHSLLVLLSIFGGISLFGAIGVFTGPLVLSLLFSLLEIYKELIKTQETRA